MFKALGQNPRGEDLLKIRSSENYREGAFENLEPTRVMTEEGSMMKALLNFLNKPANVSPKNPVPHVRTDLSGMLPEATVVWFGHSSYFIHLGGKNILVDPVFSGHASPFSFAVKNFAGSNAYAAGDMPLIDLLIITHDHYDHFDYQTLMALKPRVFNICTTLGVGSHLRYWGFDPRIIRELDWWEHYEPFSGMEVTCTPARHFSGRTLQRAQTLWGAFVLEVAGTRLFLGGDSGYGSHFKEIGKKGPFDLVILETGQYNTQWPQIHMMPEESVIAAVDLGAQCLLPVHWAKFALAFHAWNDPIKRVVSAAARVGMSVATPMIGEPFIIGGACPDRHWWEEV